jgi:hypothetical protein
MRCGDADPGVGGILAADAIPESIGIIKAAMAEWLQIVLWQR